MVSHDKIPNRSLQFINLPPFFPNCSRQCLFPRNREEKRKRRKSLKINSHGGRFALFSFVVSRSVIRFRTQGEENICPPLLPSISQSSLRKKRKKKKRMGSRKKRRKMGNPIKYQISLTNLSSPRR